MRILFTLLVAGFCIPESVALPRIQDDPEELTQKQKRVSEALKKIRSKMDVLIDQLKVRSPYYAAKLEEAKKKLGKFSPELKIDRILNHLGQNRIEKAIRDGEEGQAPRQGQEEGRCVEGRRRT